VGQLISHLHRVVQHFHLDVAVVDSVVAAAGIAADVTELVRNVLHQAVSIVRGRHFADVHFRHH